jgi:hypothetical protein
MPPFGDLHGNSHEPCTTNVGASESVGLHCRREYRHVDAANRLQKRLPLLLKTEAVRHVLSAAQRRWQSSADLGT